MTVKSGQATGGMFTTTDKNGNEANASALPVGSLRVNGELDAGVTVTVTNKDTGLYWLSCTLPALDPGDVVSLVARARVGSIYQKSVVMQDRADTKLTSDLNDLNAAAINAEVVDALTGDVIADSQPAKGSRPTIAQAVLMMTRFMQEREVVSTTVNVKKENGTTVAMTFTLNDATNPTSITRAT